MSYIGIDYGTRRVGVAVSDEGSVMAFPAEVVPRSTAIEHIVALVKDREVRGIVIGESRDFHDRENPVQAEIKKFAAELAEKTGAEIIFEPEFLTSAAAKNAGASDETLDASAAAIILQSFLDKRKAGDAASHHVSAVLSDRAASIGIDTFKKLDIRIGEILSVEKVPNADKLLKLEVSFGAERRQIISGIAMYFPDPQALVGKTVAFAYNLEPRTIRGFESEGMILAAMDEVGNFSLLESSGVAAGAKIK